MKTSYSSAYVEYKPQISSVQLVLTLPKKTKKSEDPTPHYTVTAEGSKVIVFYENLRCSWRLSQLGFIPASVHGLKWNNDELHIRMQVKGDAHELLLKRRSSSGVKPCRNNFSCFCRRCGAAILLRRSFRRVLPLPAEGWADVSEDWFCHKHHHHHDNNQQPSLKFTEADCLFNDTFLLLHDNLIKSTVMCVPSSGIVVCQRCRAQMGYRKGSSSQVFLERDLISSTDIPLCIQNPEQRLIQLLLYHRDNSASYRFIAECRTGSKFQPFLLMWLLDSSLMVYQGDVTWGEERDLHSSLGLRVLYKPCWFNTPKTLDDWRRDTSVHSIDVPYQLMLKFVDTLIRSTHSLPTSLQLLNGFMVAVLREFEHG